VYSKHRPKHENQPETNSNAANINTRNTIVSIVSPCSRVNENSARGFPQILLLPPTALSTFRAQKKRRLEKLLRATIATNASPVPLNEAETEVPTKEDAERENMLLVYMF
tara:strand:- start:56 stop:385 length:330 start_codon:yes stop_codon:yes gene_type:complete